MKERIRFLATLIAPVILVACATTPLPEGAPCTEYLSQVRTLLSSMADSGMDVVVGELDAEWVAASDSAKRRYYAAYQKLIDSFIGSETLSTETLSTEIAQLRAEWAAETQQAWESWKRGARDVSDNFRQFASDIDDLTSTKETDDLHLRMLVVRDVMLSIYQSLMTSIDNASPDSYDETHVASLMSAVDDLSSVLNEWVEMIPEAMDRCRATRWS